MTPEEQATNSQLNEKIETIIHKIDYLRHTFYKTEQIPKDVLFQIEIAILGLYSHLKPNISNLHLAIKEYETFIQEFQTKQWWNERKWKSLKNNLETCACV